MPPVITQPLIIRALRWILYGYSVQGIVRKIASIQRTITKSREKANGDVNPIIGTGDNVTAATMTMIAVGAIAAGVAVERRRKTRG